MGKKLLTILRVFLVGVVILTSVQEIRASHSMGADLTYTCLGGNTYRIRVSFYRDCIGIPAPTNVYINVRSVTCGQNLGVTGYPIPGTGQEVTPLCTTAVSSCNGGVFTGIQEWIYEGVITLPMQCTDWTFSYNLCCRNAAITNIATPASSTFYIYATLNNTIAPCNNSPTFSNKPVPFACLGQQFCFNHGAYDADGDSLVYSLITPYQNATTTVTYNTPFSSTNPLSSSPPVSFNTATGDICMTPTNLEVTVMAVLVQEYRNGVLIGTVERDIQITVLNCNNNLPTLTGINGTNNFSATVCAGQQLCFFINSADPDATQNVYINWDASIPGATFTSSGGPRPTGTFCWTPPQSAISNNAYCFTVRVNDDACPMNGAQIYSYCITVIGVDVNAGPDQSIACNDLATINAVASGGTGNYTYQWSNGVTLPIQTVGPGTYIVTVSDGVCTATDTVNVVNGFMPTAAFTASGSCPNAAIQFTDQTTLPGGIITSWNWNFGGTGTSTQQNPVHTFPGPGTYNVTLIVETNLGCIDTVVQPVVISPPPAVAFTSPGGCVGATITFNNTTTPVAGTSWNWNFGNGQTSTAQNPTTTYTTPGTYNVTLIATDASGCTATLTQPVVINPLPIPSFTNNTIACQGGTITFNNTSQAGGGTISGYNWNFGNGQSSGSQNPTTVYTNPGNYNVSLTVTNSFGCSATIVQNIGINPPPIVSAGLNQSVCLGGSATLTASGGVSYVWSPGGQTTGSITVTPSNTTVYTVVATDINGCTAQASATVTVNPLPVISVTPSQSICAGQSATLTASGGLTYNWNPTGNNTPSIVVSPGSSTSYAVTGTDANGCSSSAFTTVTVNALPVVNLSNVFICAGNTSTLNAGNPGSTYQWSTGQTSQTITINSAGTYTVTVTNPAGCTATGSAVASQSGTITNTLQNPSFCAGGSTVLNAGNPGNTYQWSTGATTQTITVNTGGAYSVTITDPNGCSGIISTTVNVNPLPVANFTPNDICINQPLQFNDISTIASGSIVSWNWDFGDGNVSQLQDPVHTYSTWGSYTVTLTVTSNNGCTSTTTRTFNVYPLPQANFSYNFSCVGEAIQFTDNSFTQMGNITNWFWDFGDGTTSNLQNPLHIFNTPGMNIVTLTITTAGGCTDTRPRNIHIYPIPSLAFTALQNGVCLGSTMTIVNNSTSSNGAINNWFWDFGDGTTSSSANPVHTYTSPGTYNVTLIGVTSHGCRDTIQQPFTVFGLPNADAGSNRDICQGTSTTLTATGGITYLWSTGATTASIQVSPNFTTTYYVTVTDANGCIGTDSVRVTVRLLPVANAGPDRTICVGNSVTLNGTGGGPGFLWNPGGYNTQTITVSPTTTTNYTYTVTSLAGCTRTDTMTVFVNPLPVANAGPDQMVCDGSTATLTATGGTSYLWSPGGMTGSSIYVTPSNPTVYTVQVTDANGCKSSDTVSVGINPVPTAVLSPAFFCVGSSTTLDAGNPGSTYLWYPNGETTQTITVSDSGYYEVQITNGAGCIGVAGVNVVVGGTNIASNPVNINICDGQTTILNAANPGATYQWSTGATSQTISVSASGTYTVTVTDQSNCSASFASNVLVNPLPQISFTPDPVCFGNTTTIQNQTTITAGNIVSWNWTFGDGGVSSSQNPSHLYTAPGIYDITLTANSGMGCSASATQQAFVNTTPSAAFAANPACAGTQVLFTDNSTIGQGAISGWLWNFGDGTSSTAQSPSHAYTNSGNYQVTLIVNSGVGCADTTTGSVFIYDTPVPQFTSQNVCAGTAVGFINTSYINDGSISGYNWNFGDGNTSTDPNPTHVFAAPGTYNVTLIATSDSGCFASVTSPVTIYPMPDAQASVSSACNGVPVPFTNLSTISNGSIVNQYWNFGNGGSSNAVNPVQTYPIDGNYNVLLVVTSDMGCVDSTTIPLTIHPAPIAGFTSTGACLGNQVQFTDLSSISSGSISNWGWNFGDGTSGTLQNPSHGYTQTGGYQATLVVTSNQGCTDTVSQTVNVYPVPVAAFAGSNVCQGTASQFFNQSTVSGGGVLNATWDFGDGNSSTDQNPVHTYSAPGTYNVTLTVNTNQGCTATHMMAYTIYAPPIPLFAAANACDGSPVQFTDMSTPTDGIISTWTWDFGDGSTSSSAAPVHAFNPAGTYNVTMTITSIYGCSATYTSPVGIYALPVPVISANANCEYDPVTFNSITAVGDTSTYQYSWTFGDGNTSSVQNPAHQYGGAGSYNVSLTMTNSNGCSATATMAVAVSPAPDADFEYANACENSQVQFTNTSAISSGTIVGNSWNFGDGSPQSNQQHPVHTFNSAGVYTVTLVVTSDNGCTDTISQQITIFPNPVAGFTYNQAAGCGPLPVAFTDTSFVSSGNIVAWNWDFGNGQTSTLQNPVAIYTASGTYGVTLTVTTDNGCTHTAVMPNIITIYPGPDAAFTPDPYQTSILNPVINFNNHSSGGVVYAWNFGDGSGSNVFEPTHTYSDTGTYEVTLIVINSYGCIDTVRQLVQIIPEFVMYIPNAFTPNNDGINEFFNVAGLGIVEVTLNIYNRWGENIYTSYGLEGGWDGTVQKDNSKAQQDVYVFDARVKDVFGRTHQQYGRVTLVR
jgi:gliding motility-associated-like protein